MPITDKLDKIINILESGGSAKSGHTIEDKVDYISGLIDNGGGSGGGSSDDIVKLTMTVVVDTDAGTETGTLNATWQQVHDWLADGKIVMYTQPHESEWNTWIESVIIKNASYSDEIYTCFTTDNYSESLTSGSDPNSYLGYHSGND